MRPDTVRTRTEKEELRAQAHVGEPKKKKKHPPRAGVEEANHSLKAYWNV